MILNSVEAAVTPNNPITFLLDWELTKKCNLDCSYCSVGEHGGHDNSVKHPPLDECLTALKFMFEYVDLYMRFKKSKSKLVILNIYGGEALHYPQIVEILDQIKSLHDPYQVDWQLTVTTTTNAIVKDNKFADIIKYIDNFTLSYHTESTDGQKEQFKRNALALQKANKPFKCIILMNPLDQHFGDAVNMVEWCKEHNVNHLARQLDNSGSHTYNKDQVIWFNKLYTDKSFNVAVDLSLPDTTVNLTEKGRACCGGRQLCINKNYKDRHFFVSNRFKDWYCSVNEYFLFVRQVNGKIYTNKDCQMNFDGQVAPIGNLSNYQELLNYTKNHLEQGTLPVIQCKKDLCLCGLCAPKAETLDDYKTIMLKYKHEK